VIIAIRDWAAAISVSTDVTALRQIAQWWRTPDTMEDRRAWWCYVLPREVVVSEILLSGGPQQIVSRSS